MPVINQSLVPTVTPGRLLATLTGDTTLNIRWFTAQDPVYFEILNRPLADAVLRQLVLAKTIDALSVNMGYQATFPFLVQAKVISGTQTIDLPPGWIWDLHFSTPTKWENFRLSKIKRLSGEELTGVHTGSLRCIFSANEHGSTTEAAVFYADYIIGSTLDFQRSRLSVVTVSEEPNAIDSGESDTVGGFITFRTLDAADTIVDAFYAALQPPVDTSTDINGNYVNPSYYEMADTVIGGVGVDSDYSIAAIRHGTGMLTDSANNLMPELDSDAQSWLSSLNYPFDLVCTRRSIDDTISIPVGMFREFNLTAPAGDSPVGDVSGLYFPVWINRIEVIDSGNDSIRLYFATLNVTDTLPSVDAIEFARLDLNRSMQAGTIIPIIPITDLRLASPTNTALQEQHFGRGHVVLSAIWGAATDTINNFFDSFATLVTPECYFSQAATRISSFGLSRVPKYIPTIGQSQALEGTTASRTVAIQPSTTNRYVTEQDQGLGNRLDLEAQQGITASTAIERYGYCGALAHRVVKLCIDHTKVPANTSTAGGTFYDDHILPRLILLLGRTPQFGDQWYDGTRFMVYNGDSWQSP